MFYLGELVR